MTTLLEARLLAGSAALLASDAPRARPGPRLAGAAFLRGQGARADRAPPKANDTAYNLEPNVKTGPGGLRDIQTIGWVAKRHFGADTLDELVDARLPHRGGAAPAASRRRPSCGRCASPCTCSTAGARTGCCSITRSGWRKSFGYEDATYTLAVEQFMQRYYRTVMDVSLLNELLLQLFREAILTESEPPRPLNARFQMRND